MNSKKLQQEFDSNQLDAVIAEDYQTRLWYSKIITSDGFIVIEKNSATLFVDSRYIEYAQNNAKNVDVVLLKKDALKKFLEQKNYQKIGFFSNYLNFNNLEKLKGFLPNAEFVPINGQNARIIKTNDEISKIQKAIDISLQAFEKAKLYLIEGITEKEVAAKLNYLMKRMGANKESFDEIVAFGANSAEPHHHPTDKKLESGHIVKMDFGALYQGYCADITRTFFFEPENPKNDPKLKEILQIVEEAAQKGRDAVKPGIKASEIDDICRSYIKSKGYGDFFLHSTGHGLGIDIHELPNVSFNKENDFILEPGMVLTVEPGIYIEGVGGARIEDDVLVTETKSKVLTRKNG